VVHLYGLGGYLSKLGISAELASSATKRGRRNGRTPWQILLDLYQYGRLGDLRLWREWQEFVTGGRRVMIRWSQDLRQLYGIEPGRPETYPDVPDNPRGERVVDQRATAEIERWLWRSFWYRDLAPWLAEVTERSEESAELLGAWLDWVGELPAGFDQEHGDVMTALIMREVERGRRPKEHPRIREIAALYRADWTQLYQERAQRRAELRAA
jgi:hypothetical protein